MKRKVAWSLLAVGVLACVSLNFTRTASSSSSRQHLAVPRSAPQIPNLFLAPPTIFTVTKTADTNDGICDADCSLREAIRAANADASANPAIIQLQAATI